MSSGTSQPKAATGGVERDLGVAGPPARAAVATPQYVHAPLGSTAGGLGLQWLWSPQSLKGWVGSLGLHATLLLTLAFWYFSPHKERPVEFDSLVAGSLNGLPDGDQLKGGSNGSPVALSSELEAFESPEPVVRSEAPLSSAIESPRLSLAPPESVLEAPASLTSSRETRTSRGRRRGNGNSGQRGRWERRRLWRGAIRQRRGTGPRHRSQGRRSPVHAHLGHQIG